CKTAGGLRIAANFFQRFRVFDGDGRINRAQFALHTGHQRARVCLRADEQVLGKRGELPLRSINLRLGRLRQIIGGGTGYHADYSPWWILTTKIPELLPDRIGLGKVTTGERLVDDGHTGSVAVIGWAEVPACHQWLPQEFEVALSDRTPRKHGHVARF